MDVLDQLQLCKSFIGKLKIKNHWSCHSLSGGVGTLLRAVHAWVLRTKLSMRKKKKKSHAYKYAGIASELDFFFSFLANF